MLRPPPRLPLSQWIEGNLRLPEGISALPGRVHLWPYQPAIADAIGDPAIERVTLVKPVRVGFTTFLTGAIGSFIVNEPCPVLVLQPTEADARDYVVSDIEPIFDATPSLAGILSDDMPEGERNTLLHRRFPGGSLKVVAAKSPRNLRRHTARVLLVDEADAMEVGKEGNPIRLGERRTLSFANRKIVIGSTPSFEDTSHVLREYAESDQRIFEVPCPQCCVFTEIMWRHIEWEQDKPETAAFRCPHCKELIHERHKPAMVKAGRWRAQKPEVSSHAGFRLNALVSLLANASWGKLAKEFLQGKDDPSELQTFTNTILAEGWSGAAEIDENDVASRAEPFSLEAIPPEVLVITIGVDVQDDRLEATVCGHTKTHGCLVLGHIEIWGSYLDDTTWFELDELLKTRWPHPHGGRLKVDAACIDAGDGEHLERVLSFTGPRLSRRVWAIKGASGARPAFQISKSKIKGARLAIVGVDGLKGQIFEKLARGRMIRFSDSLAPVYFEQLSSERRVVRYRKGQPVRTFVRIAGRRAEALDALVYSFAARSAVQVQLAAREAALKEPAASAKPKQSPAANWASSWANRFNKG